MTDPKYQWSRFVNGGRDEQFVVRADAWEEFLEAKELVINHINSLTKVEGSTMATSDRAYVDKQMVSGDEVLCPIHHVKMWEKKGKHGTFYSHGEKQPDGSWMNCSGKGFK